MDISSSTVFLAFGLTLIAGLATGIGSLIALFFKHTNKSFLSIALGFSAGVMIYVSFVEIFFEAKESLVCTLGEKIGSAATVAGFFGGIVLIAIIDKFVPSETNPHEVHDEEHDKGRLIKIGMFTALAIAIHNFPEGVATFITALKDPSLGITIAIAIAIHNIPEGIAISAPIYYATSSKKKAFRLSFLTGLSEPIGAIVGYFILLPFFNDITFGIVFSGVAGIMVYISLDQLLPTAREYGEGHIEIYGLVAGMAVMAISLLIL